MPDTSYPLGGQGVYRKQGGKELVVGSSGTLTVETGGTLSVTTGATVSFSSGTPLAVAGSTGIIVIDDSGKIAVPVTIKTTSTGTISNFGYTAIGSTSANAYTITAPDKAGLMKYIAVTVHGATTITCTITTASTNSYIRSSTAAAGDTHVLNFTSAGEAVTMVSHSTAEWRVLTTKGAVTIS